MTVGECVARADALRPNAVSEAEKVRWVCELERQLIHEFYPRYQPEEKEETPEDGEPVKEETPAPLGRESTLSGSGAFERMYTLYLMSQIDLAEQEMEAYSVDAALYQQAMDEFRKDWNRTHTHL